MGKKPTFFSELKRRQIYRGGVMYVVAGWVIVQVATQVFPYFDIPTWAIRLVVVAIMLGFPVSLVFLWMFESIDPNEPEKHLLDRRQGNRGDDGTTLAKMMEAERAERHKEAQELISALAQLKASNAAVSSGTADSTPTPNPGAGAPAAPEAIPARPIERKRRVSKMTVALGIVLVLAGVWILFGPAATVQPTAITGELTEKYVAPGFSQVENFGAELLRPLLKKLGIDIAPERVFTALLVLVAFLVLRDFYRQFVNSRSRRLRNPP